jgi:hypothetical protein
MIDETLDHDEKTEPGGGPLLKCGTTNCARTPLAFRFTWPGHAELHVCMECATMAKRAANALGFTLQVLPLEED